MGTKVKVGRPKFKRPTANQVRKTAKEGQQGGGPPLFNLPDGMEKWAPDKEGIFKINIVPYGVTEDEHPDRVKKGVIWYKRSLRVHRTPSGQIVCPKSVDRTRKCRWCTQYFKIKKEHEELEGTEDEKSEKQAAAELKPFSGQMWECYYILHPKDPSKVVFFPFSYGKFAKKLGEVEKTTNKKNLLFFETDAQGKTLKTTFVEKKFSGQKYLEAAMIEFRPREALDDDAIMAQTTDIKSVFNVLDDDRLKKLFYQSDEDEDEKPAKKKSKKSSADEDEDADSDEEDSDEDTKKPKKGKKKVMAKKDKSEKKSSKKAEEKSVEKKGKKKLKKPVKVEKEEKKKGKKKDADEEE